MKWLEAILTKINRNANIDLPGQSFSLQSSVASESPLQAPPFISSTIFDLNFSRLPLPQVAEHVPKFHSLHSQSTRRVTMWPSYIKIYPMALAIWSANISSE